MPGSASFNKKSLRRPVGIKAYRFDAFQTSRSVHPSIPLLRLAKHALTAARR